MTDLAGGVRQDSRPREPVLILNPAAGGATDPEGVQSAVREVIPCRILTTGAGGDARRFAAAARRAGAPMIVVAGGDGTVHEVASGLMEETAGSWPEVAILPLGTGNDLARCLGIPLEWEAALGLLRSGGRVRRLDLLEIELDGEPRTAVNAVVVGSGGRVGEVLDPGQKERWGPLAYLRSAAEVILDLEPVRVTLSADGGEEEALEALNIVVANGRYAARGIPIAPGADPSDGAADLVVVRDAGVRGVLGMVPDLFHGSDPDHPAWSHRRVGSVRIAAVGPDSLPVSVDGENLHARTVTARVRAGLLPVRVPLS